MVCRCAGLNGNMTGDSGGKKMISTVEIKKILQAASVEELPEFINTYRADERQGVRKLVETASKRLAALETEKTRVEGLCTYEKQYAEYDLICGVDEVGRGPLAGPVVAGAVILPKGCRILYINDSKQLSEKKREELYAEITEAAVSWAVGCASPVRIDEINILQATYEAMREALGKLEPAPKLLLNDAVTIPGISIPQIPIIKGDAKSISIGAASIVAKVTRDRMMLEYDKIYPEYGFAENKGYGSRKHIAALQKYGPTSIHRKTFIKNFVPDLGAVGEDMELE